MGNIILVLGSLLMGAIISVMQYRYYRKHEFGKRNSLGFAGLYGGFAVVMTAVVLSECLVSFGLI